MPRKISPERQADHSSAAAADEAKPTTSAPTFTSTTHPTAHNRAQSQSTTSSKASVLSSDKTATHSKKCTLCDHPWDVLVRCQIDDTSTWHFVCPGSCWRSVSGGKVDGDASHPLYRYGGMWKNKSEGVSAKKPKGRGKGGKGGGSVDLGREEGMVGASRGAEGEGVVGARGEGKDGEGDDEEDEDLPEWEGDGRKYTKNDRVRYDSLTWICRKTHTSTDLRPPDKAQNLWKEIVALAVED